MPRRSCATPQPSITITSDAHYMLGRTLVKLGREAEANEIFSKGEKPAPRPRSGAIETAVKPENPMLS